MHCDKRKETKSNQNGRGGSALPGAGLVGMLELVPYPLIVIGRLDIGASSSSPLDVRSMTADLGRFPDIEPVLEFAE